MSNEDNMMLVMAASLSFNTSITSTLRVLCHVMNEPSTHMLKEPTPSPESRLLSHSSSQSCSSFWIAFSTKKMFVTYFNKVDPSLG